MTIQELKIGQLIKYQWHNQVKTGTVIKVQDGTVYVR